MTKKNQTGFSLLELVVTFAIAALLLAAAAPSWQELVNDNRLGAQANTFITSLATARSEAIKRSLRVTVCKSRDGISCTTGSAWHEGWLVFVDPAGFGVIDTGEEILQRGDPLTGPSVMTTVQSHFANFVSFMPNGASRGGPGPNNSDQFRLCDQNANAEQRLIRVDATGRTSLSMGNRQCT